LFLELFVEAGFEFADFAATETRDVDVIAGAVGFVVMTVATKMEKVELVDEAVFLEEIDGAVDGDEMDFVVEFLGAFEDLVHVEMLFGGVHDLEDGAALSSEANAFVAEVFLEVVGGFGGVDAFTGRDAMGW